MGCSSSRVDKPCHEAALINGDESLLYKPHEILEIHESVKSLSKGSQISKKDLKLLLKKNGLSADERSMEFYERLLKNNTIGVKTLTALSSILCQGSAENKIKALFESWAEGEALSKGSFEELIDCLFDLSLEDLPTLATSPSKDNYYTDDEMSHFLQRAKSGREKAKEYIASEIFTQDFINRESLTSWFSKDENSGWLLSHGIRESLKEFGKKVRKERKRTSLGRSIDHAQPNPNVVETGPQMELIEEHHHHHQHHEHHEMKVDASE